MSAASGAGNAVPFRTEAPRDSAAVALASERRRAQQGQSMEGPKEGARKVKEDWGDVDEEAW